MAPLSRLMVWAGAVQTAAWSGAVVRTVTDDYGQLRTKRTAETDWQGELRTAGSHVERSRLVVAPAVGLLPNRRGEADTLLAATWSGADWR